MLRVRELAATGMEKSSVKEEMTGGRTWRPGMETGDGDRAWRPGMETGHGDRGRRQGMEAGNGDMERVDSQEVSGRSLPLKCSNVRSVSR